MKNFLITIAILFLFVGCSERSDLPEGYKLLCNENGKYSLELPDGYKRAYPSLNKAEVINRAWTHYDYEDVNYKECDNDKRDNN
jgi:hypothetical protein